MRSSSESTWKHHKNRWSIIYALDVLFRATAKNSAVSTWMAIWWISKSLFSDANIFIFHILRIYVQIAQSRNWIEHWTVVRMTSIEISWIGIETNDPINVQTCTECVANMRENRFINKYSCNWHESSARIENVYIEAWNDTNIMGTTCVDKQKYGIVCQFCMTLLLKVVSHREWHSHWTAAHCQRMHSLQFERRRNKWLVNEITSKNWAIIVSYWMILGKLSAAVDCRRPSYF